MGLTKPDELPHTCGIGTLGGLRQGGGDEESEVFRQRVVSIPGVVVGAWLA